MNAQPILAVTLALFAAAAQAETPQVDNTADATIEAQLNHADGVYRDGDRLRVWVETNVAMHVYVLYHQEDGQAVLLFPNPGRSDSRLNQAGRYGVPARNDEVQCLVRGDFESEAVQVLASTVPVSPLEDALTASEGSVPVLSTEKVNEICQAHAEVESLASVLLRVTLGSGE